jgi:CP family cyanate transporter-like MFS transporter
LIGRAAADLRHPPSPGSEPDELARIPSARSRQTPLWVGAALLLLTLALRLPIGAVAPVLEEIRDGVRLSPSAAGALTTLPVLFFGLSAWVAPSIGRRWRPDQVLLVCLVGIVIGMFVRIEPQTLPLYGGTLVLSISIAVANVLVPSVIKRDYQRPGTMMGLYTMTLTSGAALAAGLTVPLMHALGSWRWALVAWVVPVLGALVLWVPVARRARRRPVDAADQRIVRLWRDPTAWWVTAFMGTEALTFYVTLSWVPDILRDSGLSANQAGVMLSLCMLIGLPGSLVAPMIAARMPDQRVMTAAVAVLSALGLGGLLVLPGQLVLLWMALLGIGQGIGFGLAMTFIVLRAPDGPHAAALSGMVQGVGYLLAALGPFVVGVVHDISHGWTWPLILVLIVVGGELVAGLGVGRPAMVGQRSRAIA